jgi:gas vesicle protein
MGRSNMADWLRVIFGAGLLLTEPKGREKVRGRVRDRMSDLASAAQDQYESVSDRFEQVSDAIQDKTDWVSPMVGFLAGVGVGVGLGILFAPASGEDTRQNISETAAAARDRVRRSVNRMPSTGTEG